MPFLVQSTLDESVFEMSGNARLTPQACRRFIFDMQPKCHEQARHHEPEVSATEIIRSHLSKTIDPELPDV
jgi:hypothetical protein